ncbi:hypothetical protein GGR52DRAFT_589351 [Hypoxylon sp. FL1284]|nr:hypothetical protein GGR52DRAFT_589351 [Hypoxylon sp. FL1284]
MGGVQSAMERSSTMALGRCNCATCDGFLGELSTGQRAGFVDIKLEAAMVLRFPVPKDTMRNPVMLCPRCGAELGFTYGIVDGYVVLLQWRSIQLTFPDDTTITPDFDLLRCRIAPHPRISPATPPSRSASQPSDPADPPSQQQQRRRENAVKFSSTLHLCNRIVGELNRELSAAKRVFGTGLRRARRDVSAARVELEETREAMNAGFRMACEASSVKAELAWLRRELAEARARGPSTAVPVPSA